MITFRHSESVSVALEAAHHFGDGNVPIGSLMRLAHGVLTVALPLALAAASLAAAFLAARARPGKPVVDRPAVLAFSASDSQTPAEPGGSSARRVVQPVNHYYRVTFGDESGFRRWVERVMQFTSGLEETLSDSSDTRPVIFIQLQPTPGASPRAYVSAGARGLAANIADDVRLDPAPIPASALPGGLAMLFGDWVDAAAYERHAGGDHHA